MRRPTLVLLAGRPLVAALAVLAALATGGAAAHADDTPPRDLHLEGDHWTAWDVPESFPEGAEIYRIEKGDTLWDLASRFYGDPYLWPQLWEGNRYILDAHWIYPGDPLMIAIRVEQMQDLAELVPEEIPEEPLPEEPGDGILTAEEAAGAPVPLGTESDLYCTGYIGELEEEFPYRIVGSEYGAILPEIEPEDRDLDDPNRQTGIFGIIDTARFGLATSDIVYLDGGRAGGLAPGRLYTVVEPRQTIFHPTRRNRIGRYYRYQGRVRVLSVQEDTAIAEVVHSCSPIHVGNVLRPFEPEPVPLGRRPTEHPVNLPVATRQLRDAPALVYAEGDVLTLGEDNVVYIDRGVEDDVVPGDVFTIWRLNRPGLPPFPVGELAVLSVRGDTALAKIIDSRHIVYLGDRLSPR